MAYAQTLLRSSLSSFYFVYQFSGLSPTTEIKMLI